MKFSLRTLLRGSLLLIALVTSYAYANKLDDIHQHGVLKVAVPQDFPPFGSVGTDMKPHGYDIDMATYLAKQMHVKLKLIPVSSANRIPYLLSGRADLVISSLGKNKKRAKVIDFSHAYAPFFLGVFGVKSINVTKPSDLAGKTIGVTRGAIEDLQLTKVAPPSATIKRFEDNNTTLSAYLSGQVNLIATGNLVMASIAHRNPARLPNTKFPLKNSPCYVGLAKNEPALKAEVNKLISEGLKNGTLTKMSEKWLKEPLPDNFGQNS
ncbi:transporter substrate-binding domain-containing protein [Celerinatantimonas sp. MCCC 1A17872]|uniref:transporter substrate-binding domain-containing protein n=1 Tax=Celerinatantimonas sp. MCCC 1A17872 TaxID=3177514 RepID=UPI0038C0DF2C